MDKRLLTALENGYSLFIKKQNLINYKNIKDKLVVEKWVNKYLFKKIESAIKDGDTGLFISVDLYFTLRCKTVNVETLIDVLSKIEGLKIKCPMFKETGIYVSW